MWKDFPPTDDPSPLAIAPPEPSQADAAPRSNHQISGAARADTDTGTRGSAARQLLKPDHERLPEVWEKMAPPVTQEQARGAARKSLLRRHPIMLLGGAVIGMAGAFAGYVYWDHASRFESTDDAFVASRPFSVAPKVAGYITSVPVTDNQHVGTNDLIALIDQRDYRIALEQAQAQVAAAEANIQNIGAQITVQQAQVNASQAQLDQAQAALVFAKQQAARYQDLAENGAGSVQNAQRFDSALHQQEAAVKSAQAALAAAQQQIQSLTAQRSNAVASLGEASAQRDQAQLNLSYTRVTAGEPGRVVNLTAAVGEFAQPGSSLTMFVPDDIWVTANFKETQLAHMRPGQPVTMRVDAYPDRLIRGHVASVQPGSGTAFSLLPAENATGNYVKIVQRVPVKLLMDGQPSDLVMGPGMSVVPTVRVQAQTSLYERMTATWRSLWGRA